MIIVLFEITKYLYCCLFSLLRYLKKTTLIHLFITSQLNFICLILPSFSSPGLTGQAFLITFSLLWICVFPSINKKNALNNDSFLSAWPNLSKLDKSVYCMNIYECCSKKLVPWRCNGSLKAKKTWLFKNLLKNYRNKKFDVWTNLEVLNKYFF